MEFLMTLFTKLFLNVKLTSEFQLKRILAKLTKAVTCFYVVITII